MSSRKVGPFSNQHAIYLSFYCFSLVSMVFKISKYLKQTCCASIWKITDVMCISIPFMWDILKSHWLLNGAACVQSFIHIQWDWLGEWRFNWEPLKYLHCNCQLLTSVIRVYDANVLLLLRNQSAHQAAEWHLRGQEWLTAEERSRQSDQMAGAVEPAVLWLNTKGECSREKWWWITYRHSGYTLSKNMTLYIIPRGNSVLQSCLYLVLDMLKCLKNIRIKWTHNELINELAILTNRNYVRFCGYTSAESLMCAMLELTIFEGPLQLPLAEIIVVDSETLIYGLRFN